MGSDLVLDVPGAGKDGTGISLDTFNFAMGTVITHTFYYLFIETEILCIF